MIVDLKRYLTMKDSGVPWLGRMPEHWEVRRLKYVLKERDERSADGGEQLLRVSQFTGVTARKRADGGDEPDTRAESLVGYKLVETDDFVVNIMLAWNGSMGVSSFAGIASPAYCVYRFGTDALPWYFHNLLRSPTYKARIKAVSTGVVESRLRLYTDELYRLEALLPPLAEQAGIVRFLGYVDRRIRRYIRARQKRIKLLEEYKQAVIHQAVTGQIDVRTGKPYPAYKDSGVEWLGQVPEHWRITRLKYVAEVQTGLTLGKNYRNLPTRAYPYLRVANVQAGQTDLGNVKFIKVPDVEATRVMLRAGDVLMTEGGDIDKLGRGCVWRDEISACLHQNHIFAVRCQRNALIPEFLVWLLGSKHGRAYFELTAKKTTNLAATNSTTLRTFRVLLPPAGEQRAIAEGAAKQAESIESMVTIAQREIALLKEYRTRLIADVVTGKLDVREAAAQLPDQLEESESLDEADAVADSEATAADEAETESEESDA